MSKPFNGQTYHIREMLKNLHHMERSGWYYGEVRRHQTRAGRP